MVAASGAALFTAAGDSLATSGYRPWRAAGNRVVLGNGFVHDGLRVGLLEGKEVAYR